jgi:diadenosine tetraphosphate (Ap4A) HIT family hydrolase
MMKVNFSKFIKFNKFCVDKNNFSLRGNLFFKFKKFNFSSSTIFDKIINKEIKSEIVYEDDEVLAFQDINPVAPIHILIIPKKKDNLSGISKAEDKNIKILGTLLLTAKKLGEKFNTKEGYRIVINEGQYGGQTVNHLHLHFLAGKQFFWPPGTDSGNKKI